MLWSNVEYSSCQGKASDAKAGGESAKKVKTQNLLLVRIQGYELEPQYGAPLIGSDSANGAAKVQFGPRLIVQGEANVD